MPQETLMKHFLKNILSAIHGSVLTQLGLTMGFLALVSFISIIMSTVIADSSSGKASAINISGSLRMMSFRLLSEVQQPHKHPQVPGTIEQFEYRLSTLQKMMNDLPESDISRSLKAIQTYWARDIAPLAQQAIAPEASLPASKKLSQEIPLFVTQVDALVFLIEGDLERRIRLLRATQFVLLGVSLLISAIILWILRHQLIRLLAELLRAARSITAGSFTARVSHTGPDELGALAQAFNAMMDEISRVHANLEDRVNEKTEALTRTNQSLELLYQISQRLSSGDLNLEVVQQVLRDIEQALELGHSMLCLSEQGQFPAQRLLSNLTPEELEALCAGQDCETCFQHTADGTPPIETPGGIQVKVFPVSNSEQIQAGLRGALPVIVGANDLPREKQRIIETAGRHIANALSTMRRTEERHRLAILEERTVIARELHDSIAQSLSYLNIQVTRLGKKLDDVAEARLIAAELKGGLGAAYRELRELITTFRLRVNERGFASALQETVSEFSGKLGFDIHVTNPLAGILLTGNEEMHVIRIIREALANIQKHAHASQASITIALDEDLQQVYVCIRDNGQGFNPETPPRNHYGLIIMRDRAMILGGELSISPAPERGTQVCLRFRPHQLGGSDASFV